MIIAAIDLGTNTARLMVAELVKDQKIHVLERAREIVRLGKGFTENKIIVAEAMEKAIKVIEKFSLIARQHSPYKTIIMGTSALREASNSREFQIKLQERRIYYR